MKNLKQLYVDNLVSHFIDFMNHLIIIMINEIRNEYGDEYDAMSDWKCKHPNIVVLCQGVSTEQTIRKNIHSHCTSRERPQRNVRHLAKTYGSNFVRIGMVAA